MYIYLCMYIWMFQTWMVKLQGLNLHVRRREKCYVMFVRKLCLVTKLQANIYLRNRLATHFPAKQMEGRLCVYLSLMSLVYFSTLNYPSFVVASYIKLPIFINKQCWLFHIYSIAGHSFTFFSFCYVCLGS